MLNFVLFGPPGAGKGTQSDKLIDKYNLIHLSTGDILRSEISANSELGIEAKKFIDKGELVPDPIVIGMIEKILNNNSESKGFIFDGFPRTKNQAKALDDMLDKHNTGIAAMLALEVEHDELVRRLLHRGKNSGRSDDQSQHIIENRIRVYHNLTCPLIEYYSARNKYFAIEGMGTINETFDRLCLRIDSL